MTYPVIQVQAVQQHQCRVLKTGQTTQYSSELDDGYYQAGIAKSYTVLTTGQWSGTTNVDLLHYSAATISFDADTEKILDAANGLALFKTADVIKVTGSTSNDGVYTIATGNAAAEIVTTEAIPLDEDAGDTVLIYKRESKSNNCVVDNNTGLMWLRDPSNYPAKMGVASDGKMPWTGQLYDIFQYCAAVNAAAVGGYTDWRVPNQSEVLSAYGMEAPVGKPDAAAFPHHSGYLITSNTDPVSTSSAHMLQHGRVLFVLEDKTASDACVWLVRGGR